MTRGAFAPELEARLSPRARAEVPRRFIAFAAWLGVTLTAAQRVIALVAYDGIEPRDLPGAERELARQMFGELDSVPEGARDVVVAVCGARGGKTYVLAALRILHLALTVPLEGLAPGEVASAPLIAPDKDLAGQSLNYVKGAIGMRRELAATKAHDTTETVDLVRDGRVVEIVCRAASAKGVTGRGRSLVGAVLDEAAFFRDSSYKVNDEEVFRAITPRLLPGAQLIVASTPFAQAGLLYSLFAENHPAPSCAGLTARPVRKGIALACHAPTLTMRGHVAHLEKLVRREYERDPENAEREYGAKFLSASTTTFFDGPSIDRAIDASMVLPEPARAGDEINAGADMGFSKNSSALVVTHRRGLEVRTSEVFELKPEPGQPLKPSTTVRSMAERVRWHGGSMVMADGHYRETVVEHLADEGLGFVDAPVAPDEAYVKARMMLREGRIVLPDHPRLIRQLREVMSRSSPGGKVTIVLPKWRTGEHGDLVSAWVLAVYQSSGEVLVAEEPEPGTNEALRREADGMKRRRIEELLERQREEEDESDIPWQLRRR